MEIIEKFVESYNNYLKSHEKDFNDVELIKKIKPINKELNDFEKLYDSYEITQKYNSSEFFLLKTLGYSLDGKIHFADHLDYDLFYIYDTSSEIVFLEDEFTSEFRWHCAENSENFFKSMIIVMDARTKEQDLSRENRRNSFFTEKLLECLKINGDKYNYYPFYSHILAVDLESFNA